MTKRTVAAAALVALMLLPAPAAAKKGCNTRACEERVAAKQCSQTRVVPCIRRAAIRWRVSYPMLLRKARCESGLNPYAINGKPENGAPTDEIYGPPEKSAGLMQFMPSTWRTTPYAGRSIWSAKWNALAAGWMHHVGRGGEWVCR